MSGSDSLAQTYDFNTEYWKQSLEAFRDVLVGVSATGQTLECRAILPDFGIDQDVLTTEHRAQLDALLSISRRFRGMRIPEVVGRASATGPEQNNIELSERRASAVTGYLITGGLLSERIGEVRAVGSAEPIEDVGPVEEPFNRSVEIAWTREHNPVQDEFQPAANWTVTFGQDTSWAFAGRQRLTLTRLDTNESRQGTFEYIDASLSLGPGKLIQLLRRGAGRLPQELDDVVLDNVLRHLPMRWQRWLTEVVLEVPGSLSVTAADATAIPVTRSNMLTWAMFDGAPTFLILPPGVSSPVGEARLATTLVFGFPVPFASVSKWFDASPGLGSVFPEISTGAKVGYFELD
jgi:hypothetical protein